VLYERTIALQPEGKAEPREEQGIHGSSNFPIKIDLPVFLSRFFLIPEAVPKSDILELPRLLN
jgi:hypothetical protein